MTFKAFCLPCLLKLRLGQLEIASKVIARATRAAAAAVKGLQEQVAEANL
jgi:sialic acid synthase SpsE